jgi:hypothetical protein
MKHQRAISMFKLHIDAFSCRRTLFYMTIQPDRIGKFSWSLFFYWASIPDRIQKLMKTVTDPYPSPTMAGGLLAADRNYFYEIGGYDDGMEVWGGENLEISFRVAEHFSPILLFRLGDVAHRNKTNELYFENGFEIDYELGLVLSLDGRFEYKFL